MLSSLRDNSFCYEPKPVTWTIMLREIGEWMTVSYNDGIIYAASSYICYELHKRNGISYSKELGAAASIFCLKLYSDVNTYIDAGISKHGNNQIIRQYEKEIGLMLWNLNDPPKLSRMYFSLINKNIELESVNDESLDILNELIKEAVSEEVWLIDQLKLSEIIINKAIKSRKTQRKKSYSI